MQKKEIKLSNNETMAYLDAGNKENPWLLLVHGNMSSGVHYKPIINKLANDYYVLAPDLRGFGDSTYNKSIETLEDFADDLKLFLEALNGKSVIFVGWSTGGGVGLKFAAKYASMAEALILLESASYRGYPIYEKDEAYQPIVTKLYQSKSAMAKDPVQVMPAALALENNDIDFMKQVWDAAIYNVKKPKEDDYTLFLHETLKQRNLIDVDWALMTFNMSTSSNGVSEGDGMIKAVQCPVLSIYGKKDYIILESMFTETVEALDNAQAIVLDNGSHSPITDDPDNIVELITSFTR